MPFVDADDIADVAVAALTEDGHAGEVYELTGPRALTHAEVVERDRRARPAATCATSQVSIDDVRARRSREGVPAEVVDLLRYLFAEVLSRRTRASATASQRALGREPRDFAVFARDAAAAGVWSPLAAGVEAGGREAA